MSRAVRESIHGLKRRTPKIPQPFIEEFASDVDGVGKEILKSLSEQLKDSNCSANPQPAVPGEPPRPQIVHKGNVSVKFLPEHNRAEFAQAESMPQRRIDQTSGILNRDDLDPVRFRDLGGARHSCAGNHDLGIDFAGNVEPG